MKQLEELKDLGIVSFIDVSFFSGQLHILLYFLKKEDFAWYLVYGFQLCMSTCFLTPIMLAKDIESSLNWYIHKRANFVSQKYDALTRSIKLGSK